MKEYFTQALVLAKEDLGERDKRVYLYSSDYGKIVAKIKSAKKILSKLNGHLEPFNIVNVRVIKKGHHIADALVIKKLTPSWPLHTFLNFIKEITFEGQADPAFWLLVETALSSGRFDYPKLLASQGFDPQFASCQNCQRANPNYFFFRDTDFWCRECLPRDSGSEETTCSNGFIQLF